LNGKAKAAIENNYTVDRPLLPQLAAIGYNPADITYLALSHYQAITSKPNTKPFLRHHTGATHTGLDVLDKLRQGQLPVYCFFGVLTVGLVCFL
jgi:hypothetical protein